MVETQSTSRLIERDRAVIWHPYTAMKGFSARLAVCKAQGEFVWDEAGSRYIDATSSWWVNTHGHSHPEIAAAVGRQAAAFDQVIFADYTHEPAIALAERVLAKLPGKPARAFYSDNGSTAVEVAIKIAIQRWGKSNADERPARILALTDAYHGDTFGAMAVSARSLFTKAFERQLFRVAHLDIKAGREEALRTLKAELALGDIAAFIFEPIIQGAGGMLLHEPATFDALIRTCREAGVLCIADEVMTGFGRTGKLFACDWLSEAPDLFCLSKGLTGGMLPLGLTACSAEVFEEFLSSEASGNFYHGHSFTGNPLACAAALASLDLFERAEVWTRIAAIESAWEGLAQTLTAGIRSGSFTGIVNIRRFGTLFAFDLEVDDPGYVSRVRQRVEPFFRERGILLRPLGNTIYLLPPYCVSDASLAQIKQAILAFCEDFSSRA